MSHRHPLISSLVSIVPDAIYDKGGAVWNKHGDETRVEIDAVTGVRYDIHNGSHNLAVPQSKSIPQDELFGFLRTVASKRAEDNIAMSGIVFKLYTAKGLNDTSASAASWNPEQFTSWASTFLDPATAAKFTETIRGAIFEKSPQTTAKSKTTAQVLPKTTNTVESKPKISVAVATASTSSPSAFTSTEIEPKAQAAKSENPEQKKKGCARCGAVDKKLLRCGGCRKVLYCALSAGAGEQGQNVSCQAAHRNVHRISCHLRPPPS
jgi:hypothetical protein